MEKINKIRRKWLSLGGVILGNAMLSNQLLAAVSPALVMPKVLSFKNVNNAERITVPITNGKITNKSTLDKLNYFMRDRRSQAVHPIDTKLFTKLYNIQKNLGLSNAQIQLISGYRAPAVNAHMHATRRGVAKNSYHTRGQAMDIRIPDVALVKLRQTALNLANGGVGYYPRSNFVHIDTGPVRQWRG